MEVNNAQRNALMDTLIAGLPQPRRPNGFTVAEFSKRAGSKRPGMGPKSAKEYLDGLVEDGFLTSEQNILENGRRATVYYKKEEAP